MGRKAAAGLPHSRLAQQDAQIAGEEGVDLGGSVAGVQDRGHDALVAVIETDDVTQFMHDRRQQVVLAGDDFVFVEAPTEARSVVVDHDRGLAGRSDRRSSR